MKTAAEPILGGTQTIHLLPRWVTSASGRVTDKVTFTSEAAVACLKLEGRNETEAQICAGEFNSQWVERARVEIVACING